MTVYLCLDAMLFSQTCPAISLRDCYPEISSHFDVFSGFWGLLQSGVELSARWLPSRFRRRAPGSIPIAFKYVCGTDKSGQQVLVRLPSITSISSFALAPLTSVHPQWSRKNQDRDWQDTCTYSSDNRVWLVPGSVPFYSWSHEFTVLYKFAEFVFYFCNVPSSNVCYNLDNDLL